MDRMEEYSTLCRELEHTPSALEGTAERAEARYRRARWGRGLGAPLGSAAAACLAFVLLVNLSVPFARACGKLPVLRDLAAAVALSPSLKAAVEHDFVQPVGQTREANGVSMTVEYLIVDQKQLNIYYTVKGEMENYEDLPRLLDEAGDELSGVAVSWGGAMDEGMRHIAVDFEERKMPDRLTLECSLYPLEQETADAPAAPVGEAEDPEFPEERGTPAAVLTFELRFDPQFTTQGQVVEVGRWMEVDGQRLYVDRVEIYPTHVRLQLQDDPENTAWLKGLDFYLEDENGTRYEKISNGITATGDPEGTPFYPSHRLESSYFGDAEHLTVCITGAEWLDKGGEYARIDLKNSTAEGLPENVRLAGVRRTGDDVRLVFAQRGGHPLGTTNFHLSSWRDPEGGEHDIRSSSFSTAWAEEDREIQGFTIPAGYGCCWFTLEDCPWDTAELELAYTRFAQLDEPVEVPVK